jgi:transposase
MTREEKITRARELREQGMSMPRIGCEIGVSDSCVWKWLNPEKAQELQHKYDKTPQRAAQKRAWAEHHYRRPCAACGALMGVGVHRKGSTLCRTCWVASENARTHRRRERIALMWNAGASVSRIARALDTTSNTINVEIDRMRKDGWDVPHRRPRRAKAAA